MDFATRVDTMILAACNGDIATARALLDAEPEIARANFYAACATGEAEAVARYLSREPELARTSGGPETLKPLLYLCYSRFLSDPQRAPGMLRTAQLLLDHGADPNSFFVSPDDGKTRETALYGASGVNRNPELTALLLERGADPDDDESLYHASEVPDHACLRLILDAGPKPEWKAYCMSYKLWSDDIEGVRLFLSHATDPNIRATIGVLQGCAALHVALRRRRGRATVDLLLQHGADAHAPDHQGFSPLQLAVRFGLDETAALIRARGADPAAVTAADRFLGACWRGDQAEPPDAFSPADQSMLPEAADAGNAPAVDRLLEAGLDPAAVSYDGMSALAWGAFHGSEAVVEVCLRHRCPLEQRNSYGGTPLGTALYSAVALGRGDAQAGVIRRLIAAGADPAPLRECRRPAGYPELDAILESWPSAGS